MCGVAAEVDAEPVALFATVAPARTVPVTANLIRAASVATSAAVLVIVLGHVLPVALATIVDRSVAVVVDLIAAEFDLSELATGANLGGRDGARDAGPVVGVRAAGVIDAALRANAAAFVEPHAQPRRAVLGTLARIGELPVAERCLRVHRRVISGAGDDGEEHRASRREVLPEAFPRLRLRSHGDALKPHSV